MFTAALFSVTPSWIHPHLHQQANGRTNRGDPNDRRQFSSVRRNSWGRQCPQRISQITCWEKEARHKGAACAGNSRTAETSLKPPGADQRGPEGEANGKDGLQRELSVRMRKVGLLNVFLVTWASKLFELYNLKSKQGKGCHYVAQANLKLMILQPQMPQGWDHRYETLHLVKFYFFLFFPFLTFYSNKWILAKVYYSSVAFFYFWACIIHMCMYTCWMDHKSVLPVTSQ